MPTDIAAALARKDKVRKDAKKDLVLISACLLIYLTSLLLFAGNDRFAEAIQLMGRY